MLERFTMGSYYAVFEEGGRFFSSEMVAPTTAAFPNLCAWLSTLGPSFVKQKLRNFVKRKFPGWRPGDHGEGCFGPGSSAADPRSGRAGEC